MSILSLYKLALTVILVRRERERATCPHPQTPLLVPTNIYLKWVPLPPPILFNYKVAPSFTCN